MSNVFLRSKITLKKMIMMSLIALFPLIISGFYKNGIKLYSKELTGTLGLFKPLVFSLVGLFIGLLVNIIYEKLIKKNKKSLINSMLSSFHPLYGALIASVISINTNIFVFIGVTFVILIISKFITTSKINVVALSALIIIFITKLIGTFTYLNAYEQLKHLNLNSLDYLLGRGSGGINTTCIILLLFSYLILANQKFYKKMIPIDSTITYFICSLIYAVVINDYTLIINNLFSNGILFSFIFIATDPLSSSYTKKGQMIYGIIIGLSTFGLYLIYPPLCALGGILIGSVCHNTIDIICERK